MASLVVVVLIFLSAIRHGLTVTYFNHVAVDAFEVLSVSSASRVSPWKSGVGTTTSLDHVELLLQRHIVHRCRFYVKSSIIADGHWPILNHESMVTDFFRGMCDVSDHHIATHVCSKLAQLFGSHAILKFR